MAKAGMRPAHSTEFAWLSLILSSRHVHHWTWNRKHQLSLHKGDPEKCRRVHLNRAGQRGPK